MPTIMTLAEAPEPFRMYSLKTEVEEVMDTFFALVPIFVTGALFGLLGLNYVARAREWSAPRFDFKAFVTDAGDGVLAFVEDIKKK